MGRWILIYIYIRKIWKVKLSLFYLTKYYFFPGGHSYLATYIQMQLLKGESEILKFIAPWANLMESDVHHGLLFEVYRHRDIIVRHFCFFFITFHSSMSFLFNMNLNFFLFSFNQNYTNQSLILFSLL